MKREIFKVILLLVIFFSWFIYAVKITVKNAQTAYYTYIKYQGKNDIARIYLLNPDISQTLELILKKTEPNAKIVFNSFPFKEGFRVEYYLFPRTILLDSASLSESKLAEWKNREIDYVVSYSKDKKPFIKKL